MTLFREWMFLDIARPRADRLDWIKIPAGSHAVEEIQSPWSQGDPVMIMVKINGAKAAFSQQRLQSFSAEEHGLSRVLFGK
jgi:hypothetical protein